MIVYLLTDLMNLVVNVSQLDFFMFLYFMCFFTYKMVIKIIKDFIFIQFHFKCKLLICKHSFQFII